MDGESASSCGKKHRLFLEGAEAAVHDRSPKIVQAMIDAIHITRTSRELGTCRVFSKKVEARTLREHIESCHVSLNGAFHPGVKLLSAHTLAGRLSLGFAVTRWFGPGYPTLIYHHANCENPFNFSESRRNSFRKIFLGLRSGLKWNLIALRAPFHDESAKSYAKEMEYQDRFSAMVAASVNLAEMLVKRLKEDGSSIVAVTGLSLGGWVTNLHRTYCGSADIYIPLLAGAALDDVFLGSSYSRLTGNLSQEEAETVRKALNFEEDFRLNSHRNVFPLLARYDRIVRFGRQRVCYGRSPIVVLDKGHAMTVLSAHDLREHIWSCATRGRPQSRVEQIESPARLLAEQAS